MKYGGKRGVLIIADEIYAYGCFLGVILASFLVSEDHVLLYTASCIILLDVNGLMVGV